MKGLFVTGTDTGVGKTFVTAAIARELVAEGRRVAAIKPMESGCAVRDGALWADDAETIAEAAGGWQTPEERCLYRFEEAVAPGVAAERLGVSMDLDAVASFVGRVSSSAEVSLVEGAGGWRVPVGGGRMISDLARRLGWPVVVVARATLGTINHSLLTVEAVEQDGGAVAAVLMSARPGEAEVAEANRAEIVRHWRPAVWILGAEGWWVGVREALFHVER